MAKPPKKKADAKVDGTEPTEKAQEAPKLKNATQPLGKGVPTTPGGGIVDTTRPELVPQSPAQLFKECQDERAKIRQNLEQISTIRLEIKKHENAIKDLEADNEAKQTKIDGILDGQQRFDVKPKEGKPDFSDAFMDKSAGAKAQTG